LIAKEKTSPAPKDKWGAAGFLAEKQMAFYLRRAFADAKDCFVFNDLRIERNGEVAQFDHLVLHRFGFAIVESKSVVGELIVNAKGEFVRVFERHRTGMPSPIQQAQRQADLLRSLLIDHKESLRHRVFLGTVQGGFHEDRFRVFVAVSDNGIIRREGCDPPELCKADVIVDKIKEAIHAHERVRGIGGLVRFAMSRGEAAKQMEKDILPAMADDELQMVKTFLLERHTPLVNLPAETIAVPEVVAAIEVLPTVLSKPKVASSSEKAATLGVPESTKCKHCSDILLVILHGKFGYYYKCKSCEKNTATDPTCTQCGAKARVRKAGLNFFRLCEKCGSDLHFHTNAES